MNKEGDVITKSKNNINLFFFGLLIVKAIDTDEDFFAKEKNPRRQI